MKKQFKNQEEWNKAWDKYFDLKIAWWEYIEIIIIFVTVGIISIYISFGNIAIAIILGLTLMMCFMSGKPINLKKYLPSDKKRQKEKREFDNVFWKTMLMEIDDNKKKQKVEEIITKKEYYKAD